MNKKPFLLKMFILLVSTHIALTACEHYDFEKKESSEEENHITSPSRTGAGTSDAPFTVSELIEGADTLIGKEVWVIGYAVGETYRSMSNATFTPPFQYTTNIILSHKQQCALSSQCIPVELSTKTMKDAIALSNHPEHYRHCIMISGRVQPYFSVTGLRSINAYCWLPHYIIESSSPTEWNEEHEDYD